ncbi:MAG: hypothetical protein ABJB74_10400 [Gemmatimonas sp.]
MKKIVAISALSVLAAGTVAVGIHQRRAPAGEMTADLERDLSLANSVQSTRTGVVSAIEQGGNGSPSGHENERQAPVVTNKRAPSAAHSQMIAEVPAAPVNEAPAPAITPPVLTEPVEQIAATAEQASKAPVADPNGATGPTAVGGPAAGGIGDGNPGMDTRGNGRTGNELPTATPEPPLQRPDPTPAIAGIVGAIIRGTTPGHDNCEKGPARGASPAVGMIGAMGGAIVGGGAMPRGSLPGGNRSGRRW